VVYCSYSHLKELYAVATTLGPTTTLVDYGGNPISSTLVPTPLGNSNPLLTTASGTGATTAIGGQGTTTVVENSTTVGAGASGSVTLPATAGKTTYLRGCTVTAAVAAAIVAGLITITGLTNTLNFQFENLAVGQSVLFLSFGETGLPASAPNTPIVLNFPAITGGAAAALSIWGYQL
jgi:hypothetical protein